VELLTSFKFIRNIPQTQSNVGIMKHQLNSALMGTLRIQNASLVSYSSHTTVNYSRFELETWARCSACIIS